jgi:hypothetical protein
MKIENRRFVEEGIDRYQEARDTIIEFEREMVSWFSVNWKNGTDKLCNQSHLLLSF